jgi:hypothetical protein
VSHNNRIHLENSSVARRIRNGSPAEAEVFANTNHALIREGNPHNVTALEIGLTVVRVTVDSDIVLTTQQWISVDASSNTVDVTLNATSPYDAQRTSIKANDATFTITIIGDIDEETDFVLKEGEVIDLMYNSELLTWEVRP